MKRCIDEGIANVERCGEKQPVCKQFFMDYAIDSLQKEATNIFTDAGKIIKINDVIPLNQLRGSFLVKCEKKNVVIQFTLTPENPPSIQEYHIKKMEK